MHKRFLISVAAAALIAGAGVASAQGPGGQAGGAAQQSAPSSGGSSGGAMNNGDASKSGAPANAAGTKAPGGAMQREGGTGPHAQGAASGATGKDMKAEDGAMKKGTTASDSKSGSSDMKGTADNKGMTDKKGMTDNKGSADNKAGSSTSESKTTGNAATSATAAPPAEKRSQIVSAIRSEKVTEVKNVNFNISVGTRVPSSVHYYPLPSRIVEIYPEWRGYDFILVNGRYIILRPETHEIVYIIEG